VRKKVLKLGVSVTFWSQKSPYLGSLEGVLAITSDERVSLPAGGQLQNIPAIIELFMLQPCNLPLISAIFTLIARIRNYCTRSLREGPERE
jgi:hypothetical protein